MNWFRDLFRRLPKPELQNTTAEAEENDPEVQFHLGVISSSGEGDAQDYARAAQWYLKAAKLNHPLAQLNLGLMYARGQGVTKNESEARIWILKAAEQGDAGAQFNLGTRCHRSRVNETDSDAGESRIESYKWLQLAAAQGYNQANATCERVALGMTQEEVTEGAHRVASFLSVAKLPPG